jgi:hypothetical protein
MPTVEEDDFGEILGDSVAVLEVAVFGERIQNKEVVGDGRVLAGLATLLLVEEGEEEWLKRNDLFANR